MPENKLKMEGPEVGIAALTLVQLLLGKLRDKGILSPEERLEIIDQAIIVHEGAGGEGFSAPNERVALLLREAFVRH